MKNTIKVHIENTEYFGEAVEQLEAAGLRLALDESGEQITQFYVEFKELPEIISALIDDGYLYDEFDSDIGWVLHRFTARGISLYLKTFDYPGLVRPPTRFFERLVLVPFENIATIHTVDELFFRILRQTTFERKSHNDLIQADRRVRRVKAECGQK